MREARESHAAWAEHLEDPAHARPCSCCDTNLLNMMNAVDERVWVARYDAIIAALEKL